MDTAFVTGLGAVVSALIVFVGSAGLLMSLVLGGRLAYFVTASITLSFLLIMSVVWSINPLGPVGQLPEWDPIQAATDASSLDKFGPATEYPEGSWEEADPEDTAQNTKRAELESEATKYAEESAAEIDGAPENPDAVTIKEDSSRLLEQDGELYGATTVVATADGEDTEIVVVAQYDPGNPLGKARKIAGGIFILLVLHLFGLSRAERRAREEVQNA